MPGCREEDFKTNKAFSQYDIYGHAQRNILCPEGNEIYSFCDPSLVIITKIIQEYINANLRSPSLFRIFF